MPITINLTKTGPLLISAEDAAQVRLVDHEGNAVAMPAEGKPIALCRCGASSRKPLCDGQHKAIGFLCDPAPTDATSGPTA